MNKIKILAEDTGKLLLEKRITVGLAESCTGGLLAAQITEIPGSSAYFRGSVVAYHNKVKRKILKVPATILRKFGAVSAETAQAMARGARKVTGAHIGLSITGIAGPSGGTPEKPVGLVYIGLDARRLREVFKFDFIGERSEIRRQACERGLELLCDFLKR